MFQSGIQVLDSRLRGNDNGFVVPDPMNPSSYSLKIITPQGTAYEGTVVHTFLPTENGFAGVLAHHAPYLTSSKGGKLVARETSDTEKSFQVGQGFFEVSHNSAVFLTQSCAPEKEVPA